MCIRELERIEPDLSKRIQLTDEIVAYVTLEPCMMCAFALNLAGPLC